MNESEASNASTSESISHEWSSREIRDELDVLLRRDLLGPWDGETELITGSVGPRDRYITGLLAPLDVAEDDDPGRDDEDLDAGEFGEEGEAAALGAAARAAAAAQKADRLRKVGRVESE